MNPEIKAQWTAALRSGEYEQGHGYLSADGKFCCLGVLCELAVKAEVISKDDDSDGGLVYYANLDNILPEEVREWAGLPVDNVKDNPNNPVVIVDGQAVSLAELNDGENGHERHSFAQIADIIDQQL